MREPQVKACPSRLRLSLSATGTPASGPGSSPAAIRRSSAAARSRASSSKISRYAVIRGSTRAVRARHDSSTSHAETSRDRTRPAISSTESSHSSDISGLAAPALHFRHQQEPVERCRSVGQEALARQARRRPVLRLLHAAGAEIRLRDLESLQLIDVVDDPGELAGEPHLCLRGETEPGKGGDSPYILVG